MNDTDLRAGLQSLYKSLRRIKALLEWQKLKQSEIRPDQPPSFRLYDPTEADLRNEYAFFLSTFIQMRAMLNEGSASLPEPLRQTIQDRLARLDQQVHQLNIECPWWRS
jgi:hypothetical protein